MDARLSKDGLRVLCGVLDCGAEIARIAVDPHDYAEDYKAWYAAQPEPKPPLIAHDGRELRFGPGWAPRADEVWVLSEYARRRVRTGRQPQSRRSPLGGSTDYTPQQTEWKYHLTAKGVRAKCPACGFLQMLMPSSLQLPTTELDDIRPELRARWRRGSGWPR